MVVAWAVLLAGLMSSSLAETGTEFRRDPARDGVVRMMTFAALPAGRLPRSQITWPPSVLVRLPCESEAETKLTPVSNGLASTTPVAASGPELVIMMVLVREIGRAHV